MNAERPAVDISFLEGEAQLAHRTERRRRNSRSLVVPAAISLTWCLCVSLAGLWGRVFDHGTAAVTMLFGSLVAGSTPQGGGAVAFPVFTKLVGVDPTVARSFSLMIQAVGMTSAALIIVVSGRRIDWVAVRWAAPAAVAGFLATMVVFGDAGQPFWPVDVPGPYVRVSFTILVAAMAWLVWTGTRLPVRLVTLASPGANRRVAALLVLCGIAGGGISALVGSGADVVLYLAIVVALGIDPRVGVPTSVVVMAMVSVAGFLLLGLADGQLVVDRVGNDVVEVGGHAITATPAVEADLFGMWIAAVPIVAWGAPIGSVLVARLSARRLAVFVASLAAAEIISTILFVDELRDDAALAIYGFAVLVALLAALAWVVARRDRLFELSGLDPQSTMRRGDVDSAPDYPHHIGRKS